MKKTVWDQLTDTPRKGTFTLAIGSFLIVLFMILVAIRPAISSVIKQISSNTERRDMISRQEYKLQVLKKLIDDKNQYQTEIDLLDEVLPDFDDVEFVVQNVYAYVDNNEDITVKGMEFGFHPKTREGVDPNMEVIEVSISFQCDIEQATKFVEFLDSFPRIFNVKSVSYGSNEEGGAYPIIGNINMQIYYKIGQQSILDQEVN